MRIPTIILLLLSITAAATSAITTNPPPVPLAHPHVKLIIKRTTPSAKFNTTTTTPTITATTSATTFYVEAIIGKPPHLQSMNLALDTVTPVTWVQSFNCSQCFLSSNPNYDPRLSIPVPANDSLCSPPVAEPQPGSPAMCAYDVGFSKGILIRDALSFAAADDLAPELAFGYGLVDRITFGRPNPVSGIIGLGGGHPANILSQLGEAGRLNTSTFSYCLPPDHDGGSDQDQGLATLEFGGDAPAAAVVTRILLGPDPLYYIWVTGISANGEMLAIDPEHLLPYSNRTRSSATYSNRGRGFIVDPATPVTVLHPRTYMVLRDWVVHAFQRAFGWAPKNETVSGLDVCYQVDPAGLPFYKFPVVELHFQEGGRLPLRNVFRTLPGGDQREVCMLVRKALGVAPSALGAMNQVQTRFFYDVHKSVFAFKPDAC